MNQQQHCIVRKEVLESIAHNHKPLDNTDGRGQLINVVFVLQAYDKSRTNYFVLFLLAHSVQ